MSFKITNKFSLGADPELFLTYNDGSPKSAIGLIPGTKENPCTITDRGHSVQVDNVLLEFNVPPVTSYKEMKDNIDYILNWFTFNIPKGDKLNICTSMNFPEHELNDPQAQEFGCDPDFNAWTEAMNDPPEHQNKLLRSAGGHVHISYPKPNMDTSIALIKALDLFLGIPSIIMDPDTERRNLYGKAGCFRFKHYSNNEGGVEYRTLSNFWIKDLKYVKFIFQGIDKAFSFIKKNDEIDSNSELAFLLKDTINTSNVEMARKLIKQYKL